MYNQNYKNIIILLLTAVLLFDNYVKIKAIYINLEIKFILSFITLLIAIFCYKKYKSTKTHKDEKWLNEIINNQFKILLKYINPFKKTKVTLLLGLDNIGKSSLLKQRYSQIISVKNKSSISWWYKNNHVICCAAPRINSQQTAMYSNRTWKKICKKLIFRRLKQPFDQIIILIHIPALHKPHESNQARDIDQINTALFTILKYHIKTNCKIVFTQADYIQGFTENFIHLDNDYHKNNLAITFNKNISNIIDKLYDKQFDNLLNKLTNNLYKSIKNTNNLKTKEKILTFPLQMQNLKQPIKRLISQLYLPDKHNISSINFCSSLQNNVEFDYLNNTLINNKQIDFSTQFFCNTLEFNKPIKKYNYLTATLIFIACVILLKLNYTNRLNQTNKNLKYLLTSNNIANIIEETNSIALERQFLIKLSPELSNKIKHLQSLYKKKLQQTIIPTIKKDLISILNSTTAEFEKAKAANIILLFHKQQINKTDKKILTNWIQSNLNIHSKATALTVAEDIRQLIKQNNNHKITLANNILNSLNTSEKVILQAVQQQSTIFIPHTHFKIAQGFSLADFREITNKHIPKICKNDQCTEASINHYLQLYLAYWSNVLNNPIFIHNKSIIDIEKIMYYIDKVLTTINSKQTTIISNNLHSQWKKIKIKKHIQNISSNLSINKNIALIKSVNVQKPNTLNNRVDYIWQFHINKAFTKELSAILGNQIQDLWQMSIIPKYQSIENLYPFKKHSQQDISLEEFKNFFSQNQETSRFIETYIKPFAIFKNSNWENKEESFIKFNQTFLNQLTLFTWIQRMFFNNNNLFLRLNLIPQKLQPNIKLIELNINNKKINIFSGTEPAITITWPFIHQDYMSINVTDINKNKFYQITSGDWALFKLIEKGKIYTTNNSRDLLLKLNIQNQPVNFRLITENNINPFIFKIFDNFKLSSNILNI